MAKKIVIGADHRGFELKSYLTGVKNIASFDIDWHDVGAFSQERSDYPIFSKKITDVMLLDSNTLGIGICGSGIGISIAANRIKHIYAGLAWNEAVARMAKEDDHVNLLVLPADFISHDEAYGIVASWLSAKFKQDPRYGQRLAMLDSF